LVNLKQKVNNIQNVVMKQKEKELMQAALRLVFLSDYLHQFFLFLLHHHILNIIDFLL
jgi:hypothetical protein